MLEHWLQKDWQKWTNDVNKMILDTPFRERGASIWQLHYRPEYRCLTFFGDGVMCFKGVINENNQRILMVNVNRRSIHKDTCVLGIDPEILVNNGDKEEPLCQTMALTPSEFIDIIKQKMKNYSPSKNMYDDKVMTAD